MKLHETVNALRHASPGAWKKALLCFFGAALLILSFAVGYHLFDEPEPPSMSASAQEALIRGFIAAINADDTDSARRFIIEEVPYRVPANEFGRRIAAELKLAFIAEPSFEGAPVREIELDTLDTAKIMSRAALEYLNIFGERTGTEAPDEEDGDLAKIYGALLKIEPLPRTKRLVLIPFAFTDVEGEETGVLKIVYNSFVAEAFSGDLNKNMERIQP